MELFDIQATVATSLWSVLGVAVVLAFVFRSRLRKWAYPRSLEKENEAKTKQLRHRLDQLSLDAAESFDPAFAGVRSETEAEDAVESWVRGNAIAEGDRCYGTTVAESIWMGDLSLKCSASDNLRRQRWLEKAESHIDRGESAADNWKRKCAAASRVLPLAQPRLSNNLLHS